MPPSSWIRHWASRHVTSSYTIGDNQKSRLISLLFSSISRGLRKFKSTTILIQSSFIFYNVKSKATPELRADVLIEIIKRRGVAKYDVFCDLLRKNNADLADRLTGSSSESDFV